MKKFLVMVAGVAMIAAPAALGQERPFRLFYTNAGLSNGANTNSDAVDPTAELGVNPVRNAAIGETVRLYVWGQIMGNNGGPPSSPNNVIYNGVSFFNKVTSGAGGSITGFSFWNYTNGSYGSSALFPSGGRWQQRNALIDPGLDGLPNTPDDGLDGVLMLGGAVVGGAGVNNSAAAVTQDRQHRRFATDGTTRIDATLLGYIEVQGTQIGQLQLKLGVGTSGIVQSGDPTANRIYLGWGDESFVVNGQGFRMFSPIADATINIVPEPAGLLLLSLAGLALRRR